MSVTGVLVVLLLLLTLQGQVVTSTFPVDLGTSAWTGKSTCRGGQPVTVSIQPGTTPIISLKVDTNVTSLKGFEIRKARVYYLVRGGLNVGSVLNTTLADKTTTVYVAEAPETAGEPDALEKARFTFSGSQANFMTVDVELTCGLVILQYTSVTTEAPGATKPAASRGIGATIREKLNTVLIYAPILGTVGMVLLVWIVGYCCRRRLFGDDDAIEAAYGAVNEDAKTLDAPLNPSFSKNRGGSGGGGEEDDDLPPPPQRPPVATATAVPISEPSDDCL